MARHNWSKIRAEYVSTNKSQRELAAKYGVSASQLAARASKEEWRKKREAHRNKVAEKAQQKAAEKEAEAMAQQLINIRDAADNLAALIAQVSGDAGNLRVGRTRKPDTKALKNITGSLKDVLDVVRDVYELPNLRDRARLETGNGAREVHVTFDTDEESDEEGGMDGEGGPDGQTSGAEPGQP